MRTIHVTSGRLFGGIEQMLLTLAKCRGVAPEMEPAFAIASAGRLDEELRETGVDVTALGDVRLSRPASIVRGRAVLTELLQKRRASAVVCHAPWSFAIFAPVARRAGVPVVLWQHDRADGRSIVERWARRTPADLVVCNSQWTAMTAHALQPTAPRVVIHPAVALAPGAGSVRADVRRMLDERDDAVVILAASRMEPLKGHLSVLRALATLRDLPSWSMWLAGGAQRPHEREYAAALTAEASTLGIGPRVKFLGERRDVHRLMAAADLFCQMNNRPETFGIVFAEALLSGLPVVTPALGGAPEIVSRECGYLIPDGDVGALTRALAMLVRDPTLRARLGSAGPAHASARCAPEIVLPQLSRALRALDRTAAA
jgi:glycosyltransferase involved in cell wall biosynthesis